MIKIDNKQKRILKNSFAYFYLIIAVLCLFVSVSNVTLVVDKPAFRAGAIVFSILMIAAIVTYFLIGVLGFYFLLILFATTALVHLVLLYGLLGWISLGRLIITEIGCLALMGETAYAISISVEKRKTSCGD